MKLLAIFAVTCFWPAAVFADTKVRLPSPELFARDAKEFLVTTTIPGTFTTLEGIVAALLILGDQAADKNLNAPYSPTAITSTSGGKNPLPLASYFRGARLTEDTIILAFSAEAMLYLDSTVAIQQVVKGSIEGTVRLHFPAIKDIQYEIDGKIVSEWDA